MPQEKQTENRNNHFFFPRSQWAFISTILTPKITSAPKNALIAQRLAVRISGGLRSLPKSGAVCGIVLPQACQMSQNKAAHCRPIFQQALRGSPSQMAQTICSYCCWLSDGSSQGLQSLQHRRWAYLDCTEDRVFDWGRVLSKFQPKSRFSLA